MTLNLVDLSCMLFIDQLCLILPFTRCYHLEVRLYLRGVVFLRSMTA